MMRELFGRKVEVVTADTTYEGTLMEVGEAEVHLQAETGWIVVPVDRVVEIRAAE